MLKRLVAIAALFPLAAHGQALQWQREPATAPAPGVVWEPLPQEASQPNTPSVSWEPVPAAEVDQPFKAAAPREQPAVAEQQAKPKDPFVTGGLYQIRRGDIGLPAITQNIPSAYGAKFGTFQTGLWLESCNTVGGTVCGTNNFKTEFNSNGKGIWTLFAGIGDPTKLIGIDLGLQITSLATTRPDQNSPGTEFGSGQGLDLFISRNLSENFSVKLGAFNLVKFDEVQLDQGSSAFGLFSGRFDLGGHPDDNSHDLYITIGAANGRYRPLNIIVDDQAQECARNVAQKGQRSRFKYGDYCNIWGLDYGSPYPVASVAYMVNDQFSLIAEWWGRNLSLAASFKPLADVNWTITPGITSLIKNADWDPSIPGYTTTPRFQLTTSIGF